MKYFARLKSTLNYKDIIVVIDAEETSSSAEKQRLALNKVAKRNLWQPDDFKKYGYTKISFQKEGEEPAVTDDVVITKYVEYVITDNATPIAVVQSQRCADKFVEQKIKQYPMGHVYSIVAVRKYMFEGQANKYNCAAF